MVTNELTFCSEYLNLNHLPMLKACLFDLGLNVAFNNLSVILWRCLDVAGSSMLKIIPGFR